MNASDSGGRIRPPREVAVKLQAGQLLRRRRRRHLVARRRGVDLKGVSLQDSSGLSVDNRLTATTLDDLMVVASGLGTRSCVSLLDLRCRSPAAATPCPTGSSTPAPGPRRAGCAPEPAHATGTNTLAGVVMTGPGGC